MPQAIQVAVDDIRMVSAITQEDALDLLHVHVQGAEKYKTRIVFKSDAWILFVHETQDTVLRLCGFDISR
jgi:hypothetical protein